MCISRREFVSSDSHLWLNVTVQMISHSTLYNLANSLGALAMIVVVAYHFVAVSARELGKIQGSAQAS